MQLREGLLDTDAATAELEGASVATAGELIAPLTSCKDVTDEPLRELP